MECRVCHISKQPSDFYGHQTRCKACSLVAQAEHRRRNIIEIRARNRQYRLRNAERLKEQRKKYKRVFPAGYREQWHLANPQKRAANQLIHYMTRKGKMIRPTECSSCFGPGPIHAHHHDYSKPLEVDWICAGCHRMITVIEKSVLGCYGRINSWWAT